jgi:hypothetical protein
MIAEGLMQHSPELAGLVKMREGHIVSAQAHN